MSSLSPPRPAVLVTGASRGIGRAIALRPAGGGFAVVVDYASASVAEVRVVGGDARAIHADIASAADVGRLFDATERAIGGADVLVSNAGVLHTGALAETEEAHFEHLPSFI